VDKYMGRSLSNALPTRLNPVHRRPARLRHLLSTTSYRSVMLLPLRNLVITVCSNNETVSRFINASAAAGGPGYSTYSIHCAPGRNDVADACVLTDDTSRLALREVLALKGEIFKLYEHGRNDMKDTSREFRDTRNEFSAQVRDVRSALEGVRRECADSQREVSHLRGEVASLRILLMAVLRALFSSAPMI
jgi:hypothetical protein